MRKSSLAAAASAIATLALAAGWLTAGCARAQPVGDAAKGKDAFDEQCSQCHTIGAINQGPNLVGVVGRKAGTSPDFPYTAAMKASGIVWTPANLEKFLANSQGIIPGTAMSVTVASDTDRINIVAYLAKLKAH